MSAGALGTPQVLERSGVGKKEVLEKAGVKVVSEVDGVGEAYQGELNDDFSLPSCCRSDVD